MKKLKYQHQINTYKLAVLFDVLVEYPDFVEENFPS